MKKQRHIKTFLEKYGNGDMYQEAIDASFDNRKLDNEEQFNKLPYLGYLRIEVDGLYSSWWHESNEDWTVAKILRVNEDTVDYVVWDSHHYTYWWATKKFEGFHVEGNVLRKD